MSTLHLRVKYRPLRIGWCIRDGNLEDLRRALRLTYTLWGGCYNPVIPLGDVEQGKEIVEAFHLDALYPVSADPSIKAFTESFKHLHWPVFFQDLFIEGYLDKAKKTATLLDIYHPIRQLYEEHIYKHPEPFISAVQYEWPNDDPLGDVLLASFGGYPSIEEIGIDYTAFFIKYLNGKKTTINVNAPVDSLAYNQLSPRIVSAHDLLSYGWHQSGDNLGFYIGSCSSFTDIVNYWNLKASGISLAFHDPAYSDRLRLSKDQHLAGLREKFSPQSEWPERISVWCNSREQEIDLAEFGPNLLRCSVQSRYSRSFPVKSTPRHFDEHTIVASVDDTGSRPSVTFQLPEKPFFNEPHTHSQHLVVSVHPPVDIPRENVTFDPPFIPELNEYYGRNFHFRWDHVRIEPHATGIVDTVSSPDLTIRALPSRELIETIFGAFGMKAKASPAGLVGSRLIQQMGALQGCRVFKIEGVRQLIEKYGPLQSFTRSAAITAIGQSDPNTGQPSFSKYEDLHIEVRKGGKLTPQDAFNYLLKKEVFRAGLKLICPNCRLEFWLSLDDIATLATCDYCGDRFNVTTQLRDRDWAYRRSGLFGREGHQEGSIPVALALQQLDTCLHSFEMIYCTGIEIKPDGADIRRCESDFAVVSRGRDDIVNLTIGECKTRKEITQDDIDKLTQIAKAFPYTRAKTYLLFSKTSQFTEAEIERFKALDKSDKYNLILFSQDELEPYFLYERSEGKLGTRVHASSLDDMVAATKAIFFNQ